MGQDFCKSCDNCNNGNKSRRDNDPDEENMFSQQNILKESNVEYNNRNIFNSEPKLNESAMTFSKKEIDKLDKITKKNKLIKIIKLFKILKEKKKEAHKNIIKENNLFMDGKYITVEGDDDIDVDLFPTKEYSYIGSKFNNKKDGFGIEIFKSDDQKDIKFIGNFLNGKRVGVCKFINDSLGYTYEGYTLQNFTGEYGIYKNINLNINYEGEWLNDRKDGYGIEIYRDKSNYKGEFLNGDKDGVGRYEWADGSVYEGEWFNNKIEGTGIYSFKDGSIYSGQWNDNKMDGFGKFLFPGEKTYIGFFKEDSKFGFGIIFWYNQNKCFIGFFENNKQNGHGKYISDDKIKFGLWNDAKKVESIKDKETFIDSLLDNEKSFSKYFEFSYEDAKAFVNKFGDI